MKPDLAQIHVSNGDRPVAFSTTALAAKELNSRRSNEEKQPPTDISWADIFGHHCNSAAFRGDKTRVRNRFRRCDQRLGDPQPIRVP